MYNKELNDTILKDKIKMELTKIGYLVDLDKLEKVINKDKEYIKEYNKETEELEKIIKEENLECFKEIGDIVKYKEIMLSLFGHILIENKKYIEARKRINNYYRNLIEILKEDITKNI